MRRFIICCLLLILLTSCSFIVTITPIDDVVTVTPSSTFTASPSVTASFTPTATETATMTSTATRIFTLTPSPTFAPIPVVNPLRKAYFYIQPANATCPSLVDDFQTIILTYRREACRDAIRDAGFTDLIWQYLRFDGFHDPENAWGNPNATCQTTGFGNNVAYRMTEGISDSCWIRNHHPDWALRPASGGAYIRTSDGFILTDPANPEWRAFWIARALEMQANEGWYGVFLDNVSASRNNAKVPLADYPDDKSYQDAITGFLEAIRAAFGTRPLGANLIFPTTSDVAYRYAFYLDLVMEEAAYVNWQNGYYSATQYEAQLTRLETIRHLQNYSGSGVDILSVAQGTQGDTARLNFSIASHLLIADERMSLRYTHKDYYAQVWLYPEYDTAAQLGRATDVRIEVAPNVWRRPYEHGFVEVDLNINLGLVVVVP